MRTRIPPEVVPQRSLWRSAARFPLLAWRIARWGAWRGGWLPRYLLRHRPLDVARLPRDAPIDVIVLVTDHFEPARRFGDAAAVESVSAWCAAYERLAERHRDADGRPPRHTWFYRYDYPNLGCLRVLSECAFRGFGEIEFHLHHGHDTHESFAATLNDGLAWFNQYGAMLTAAARPRPAFGYIAGNWALDNGAGDPALSGCDTELAALGDAGCYADFTFPSLGSHAQPRRTNAIYYATEDGRPKSYDSGIDVAVGGSAVGDLMIFEGPLTLDRAGGRIEDSALEDGNPPHPGRLPAWLSAHVHVRGRPEWVFVKLHTHAMQSKASFLGPAMDATFAAMEERWNRPPFRLHYVTAREAYNLAKAAEAGHSGDPNDYRDFAVPPPANALACCDVPWSLRCGSSELLSIEFKGQAATRVQLSRGELREVRGAMQRVDVRYRDAAVASLTITGAGPFATDPPHLASLIRTTASRRVGASATPQRAS